MSAHYRSDIQATGAGVFTDTMPTQAMFDNPRVRFRRAPSNHFPFVRRVKGGAWQSRVWLGAHAGGSLNLGLFTVAKWETEDDAEWAAARASKEFMRFYRPYQAGGGLRDTMEHLKRPVGRPPKPFIPADVLPPRIRISDDGTGYIARARKGDVSIFCPGVFACPWNAYERLCAVLVKVFPRSAGKSELRAAARAAKEARRREWERKHYGEDGVVSWLAA